MPSESFYLLKTCTICVIFLYNCIQCIDGFSILLQRYVTEGNDAKNRSIFSFCLLLNATHAQLLEKLRPICFSRNVPFSSDPVVRISRNKKIDQRPCDVLNFDIGNF